MDEITLCHQITDLLSQGEIEQANSLASQACTQFPEHAQLQFIYAAIGAQLEQYPEAVQRYQHALSINPNLHIARFQLGLLLSTLDANEEAENVLLPLSQDVSHYLGCFAKAVILLQNAATLEPFQQRQIFIEAFQWLEQGIENNNQNPILNDDMRLMKARVEAELNTEEAETEEEIAPDQSHLLDIYQQRRE